METNKNVEFEPIATRCCGLDVHKVEIVAAEHNRMICVFEDANLKLSSVCSDVTVSQTNIFE